MLLAIDTATRIASVALYEVTTSPTPLSSEIALRQGGASGAVLSERTWHSKDGHTVELVPSIVGMLEQGKVAPQDLSAVAVALGPGSFTGLRIGMSVAKGLAFALDIPLVGIPTLDVLAYPHANQKLPTCAIIQAGRSRICTALYHKKQVRWQRLNDYRLTTLDDLCATIERRTLFCGEISPKAAQTLRQRLAKLAVIASPASSLRRAGYLAELGWQRIERGEVDDPVTLAPIYLSIGM